MQQLATAARNGSRITDAIVQPLAAARTLWAESCQALAKALAVMTTKHRQALLSLLSNSSVLAWNAGDRELALWFVEGTLPFSRENAYLPHAAACALVHAGRLDEAIEQVGRALESHYPKPLLEETARIDVDLAPILQRAEVRTMFAAYDARVAEAARKERQRTTIAGALEVPGTKELSLRLGDDQLPIDDSVKLTELEHLEILGAAVAEVPAALGQLRKLRTLTVRLNMRSIADEVFLLPELEEVSLYGRLPKAYDSCVSCRPCCTASAFARLL